MTIGSVVVGALLGFAIRPLNLSPQVILFTDIIYESNLKTTGCIRRPFETHYA